MGHELLMLEVKEEALSSLGNQAVNVEFSNSTNISVLKLTSLDFTESSPSASAGLEEALRQSVEGLRGQVVSR